MGSSCAVRHDVIIEDLKRACRGAIIAAGDPQFLDAIHGTLWNRLIPDRAPEVVVEAADEEDIIAAVRFARTNGLKVTVRGGGHSGAGPACVATAC